MVKRIAVIEPVGGHGGMNYYDLSLMRALGSKCECFLFTCEETLPPEDRAVRVISTFGKLWSFNSKLLKLIYFVFCFLHTSFLTVRMNLEIAHFHFFKFTVLELFQVVVMKLLFKKVVVTVHDVESFEGNDSSLIVKCTLSLIDHAIVHNEYSEFSLNKVYTGKLSVIKHGNYLDYFSKAERAISSQSESLNILFFGQIKEVKGLDLLLKALAKLKVSSKYFPFRLRISGKFWKSDSQKYVSFVKDNDLQEFVTFDIRYIPDDEVEAIYSEADLVILPYKKIYQSGVLLMAMSIGTAVLVSDLKPMREVIIDGFNGFTFESENIDSLAQQLLKLSSDRGLVESARNNAYETMRKDFGWEQIGQRTVSLYEKL